MSASFDEKLFASGVANAVLAYWLSTCPNQPTTHWLGFYVVMGTIDYVLLTMNHVLRFGRGNG